jgi:hypothetical protein
LTALGDYYFAMPAFHLATFAVNVTPPDGHPLCGGWIDPVRGVDDPLKALGIVLLGQGKPVVLCVFDWVALRNDAHLAVRQALADAAHTTIDHVSVHAVHPHNAPFADVVAQKLLDDTKGPPSLDLKFFAKIVKDVAAACSDALTKTKQFTHIGIGSSIVKEVASNRRVLGPDGKVQFTRTSATKNKEARDAAEGLIDPVLRTLSFWNGDTPLVAMHYYATHPMSYYGDGRVSTDFCGLARQKLQDDDPKVFQMYFTGCAGNVTAGKYNDGAKENRPILRDRMYVGMKLSFASTKKVAVNGWDWRIEPVKLPPRKEANFGEAESRRALEDEKATKAKRGNAAFQLAWLQRQDRPIEIGCLDFGGNLFILLLPGEPFIEYQLAAGKMRSDKMVMVAGYGDDGCGYIPTAPAYLEGGYEPTVALAGPESEAILLKAMAKLLKAKLPE